MKLFAILLFLNWSFQNCHTKNTGPYRKLFFITLMISVCLLKIGDPKAENVILCNSGYRFWSNKTSHNFFINSNSFSTNSLAWISASKVGPPLSISSKSGLIKALTSFRPFLLSDNFLTLAMAETSSRFRNSTKCLENKSLDFFTKSSICPSENEQKKNIN